MQDCFSKVKYMTWIAESAFFVVVVVFSPLLPWHDLLWFFGGGNFPTLPLAKGLVMKAGKLQRTVYRNRGPGHSKQDGD